MKLMIYNLLIISEVLKKLYKYPDLSKSVDYPPNVHTVITQIYDEEVIYCNAPKIILTFDECSKTIPKFIPNTKFTTKVQVVVGENKEYNKFLELAKKNDLTEFQIVSNNKYDFY
jgi:hypothetical protein